MISHSHFQTLNDVLFARANSEHSITFIEGQNQRHAVGFGQMLQRAKQRLSLFQAQGATSGSFLLIQSSDNALFIEAFWACLLGGIVAVPVAAGNSQEHRQKLFRIEQMLDSPVLFTDDKNLQRIKQFSAEAGLDAEFDRLSSRVCLSEAQLNSANAPVLAEPAPDDIAFIQFSSGSTSTPKGVVLSHHNLVTNTGSIIDGCAMTSKDHLLSWMPLTHDMGLIGFHLTPLLCDTSHSLIPTDVFVRRPTIWLTETQQMQASILCSPNFGYQHVLKSFKPEKQNALDLSSVRLLFNGAEPISVSLCHEFMQNMAPFGLDANAMIPVYGLAEASLAVTFPELHKRFTTITLDRSSLGLGETVTTIGDDNDGVQFVAVGKPVTHVELCVKDEQGELCASDVTGRLCIRGANVTRGYYNEPELNAQLIDSEGWLDTGDLGLIHDDQLYITGRAKDIIFVNGQNVYPHDLEELLFQQGIVERGKVAITSQPNANESSENLLVFVLHRGDLSELEPLARNLTRTLAKEAGVNVHAVVAVPRIPKTTSGKVQRFHLVNEFEQGAFESIVQAPQIEAESEKELETHVSSEQAGNGDLSIGDQLLAICNSHVEGMTVGSDDNLFDLGISSLTLAQIHASIEDTWPDQVEITDLFDYPTVTELSAFLNEKA